jgi:hypothetical protein
MKIAASPMVRQAILAAGLMMAWQVAAKATRDSLFLSVFEPSALPAMTGAAAVCAMVMALLSAKLLRRFGPFRVIPAGYALGGVLHAAEWILLPRFPRPVAALVYVHVIALGSVLLSGFWALANERFDPREARRQFGHITAFGTLGSLAGGLLAERVATLASSRDLLLLLALLQVVCFVALFRFAPAKPKQKAPEAPSIPDVISGAPYLAGLAAFVLLAAMSAASLDYLFKVQAASAFGRTAALSRFFALFYAGTSVVTFALQAGVSRFWLKRFGPGKTVAVLPVAVTGASLISLLVPGAIVLMITRGLEQLLRGSLYRSGYELFYTPMPAAEKRSVKSMIDIGAERLGDGLAAATIQLMIVLPAAMSSRLILGMTAVLSALAAWLAFRLDRAYVGVLEKGLENHTVTISPEEAEDFVTKSIVLKTMPLVTAAARQAHETVAAAPADPIVRKLAELRSADPLRVCTALHRIESLDPILVPQVIQLLGRDETARSAYSVLGKFADRIAGQLADALADPSVDFKIRKRIPKILAACKNGPAWEGLHRQLRDERFEIRLRCARALEQILLRHPECQPDRDTIFELVGIELSSRGDLRHDSQHDSQPDSAGGAQHHMVQEVLRERTSKRLTYIATLLGLVLPPQSVRLAFRALRTEDAKLRGVALEYLDSVLPHSLREQLSARMEGPAPARGAMRPEEALANLLESSPSIVARLEEMGFDAPE